MTPVRPPVTLVTYNYPPLGGGVSRYYFELSQAYGEQMRVVSPFTGERPMPAGDGLSARIHQTRFAASLDPAGTLPLFGHPHLALPSALRSRPFGMVVHGGEWARLGGIGPRVVDFVASKARIVIANSRATQTRWLPHASRAGKVAVVHPGVPERWLRLGEEVVANRNHCHEGPYRWVAVSRLVRRKRVPELMQAFLQACSRSQRELHLDVVGSGPDGEHVRRLAAGSPSAITYHESVTDSALADLYAEAHAFALCPTELDSSEGFEGYGIVFLEAAAFGLPTVATSTGGVAEAVDPNGARLLGQDDWRGVVEALVLISNRASVAEDMSRSNFSWAARNGWMTRADELGRVLQDVEPQ